VGEEIEEADTAVFRAVESLTSEGIVVEGNCSKGYPSETILKRCEREKSNVIIIPTPYFEKAEKPGVHSLGATVDILLKKAPCPTILVKTPIQKPENITKKILLPIQSMKDYRVAKWALTLAEKNSKLLLLNVVEKTAVEKAKEIAEKFLEAKLDEGSISYIERKLHKDGGNLMVNIARKGQEKGIDIKRRIKVGDETAVTFEEMEKERISMLILAAKPEKGNTIGLKVENLARLSSIPVLIIK
jgi:nucleotide-binding universal stress UspA family protein